MWWPFFKQRPRREDERLSFARNLARAKGADAKLVPEIVKRLDEIPRAKVWLKLLQAAVLGIAVYFAVKYCLAWLLGTPR